MQWVQMGTSRNENASICPKFEWLVHLCLDQYQSINILFLFPSSPVPPSLPLPLPSPAALLPSLSSTPSVGDEYEEYRMWSKNKTKRRGYEQVDDGDGDDGDDDGDMNDGRARRQGAPGKMHSPKTQLIIGYISRSYIRFWFRTGNVLRNWETRSNSHFVMTVFLFTSFGYPTTDRRKWKSNG